MINNKNRLKDHKKNYSVEKSMASVCGKMTYKYNIIIKTLTIIRILLKYYRSRSKTKSKTKAVRGLVTTTKNCLFMGLLTQVLPSRVLAITVVH